MTATLCASGAVILKAGKNAPTLITEAQYDQLINQAEAFINTSSRYDWVTNYASIPATTKQILEDAASSMAAIALINYDMSGYTSRTESQVMLDVNWSRLVECINLLRDDKFRTFIKQGS